MYKLIMKRYGTDAVFNFNTLKEAVNAALGQLEVAVAFPHSISKENREIWKFKTLRGMTTELERLIENEN